jgi:hypothetical protein
MKKAICLIIIGSLLVMPCSQAFAKHDGGHYQHVNDKDFKDGWIWFNIVAATLALGAIFASLLPKQEAVVKQPIVIQQPVVVQQPVYIPTPSNSTGETFVVNIPNSNGSYTPVTLVKSGNGYVGPQGEFYPGSPSVDQLRVIYGK